MQTIPPLKSLSGKPVLFTGRLSEVRSSASKKAKRAKASVQTKVAGSTSVVVQGAPSPSYKWPTIGVKLKEVERRRRTGQLIYVIGELEFNRLLNGQGLTLAASRAAAGGATSAFGIAYRPEPVRSVKGSAWVNLDARDRATAAHRELVQMLAQRVEDAGLKPLSSASRSCMFDLAWQDGHNFNVVEAKTLNHDRDLQQLRLGLGQVLEYAYSLRSGGVTRVRPLLVTSRAPHAVHFPEVCASVDVEVSWPATFSRLF